ncbi:hypothetical protein M0802_002254 [Mischocyttarus mexicanus]|nr:hypothetical protein M0802_002254 [Mischocyttarus mexicanus]
MHAGYRLNQPWLMKDWLYGLTKYSIFDNKEFDTNYAYCYDIIKKIEESKYLNKGSDTLTKDENNQETNENISMVEYMINVKQTTPNFNYNDILDEVGTFMLAGLESVSTATALGLFQLANHPEWQEKCYEELNEIFNDLGTLTSTNSLNKMKYLDMCIKETLRLYPTVPIIGRCLSEDTDFDGITVPAGSDVFISPYITHRIPDYYPDPESYQPERFESDNFKNFRPCVYIPFGAGSRKCIGK